MSSRFFLIALTAAYAEYILRCHASSIETRVTSDTQAGRNPQVLYRRLMRSQHTDAPSQSLTRLGKPDAQDGAFDKSADSTPSTIKSLTNQVVSEELSSKSLPSVKPLSKVRMISDPRKAAGFKPAAARSTAVGKEKPKTATASSHAPAPHHVPLAKRPAARPTVAPNPVEAAAAEAAAAAKAAAKAAEAAAKAAGEAMKEGQAAAKRAKTQAAVKRAKSRKVVGTAKKKKEVAARKLLPKKVQAMQESHAIAKKQLKKSIATKEEELSAKQAVKEKKEVAHRTAREKRLVSHRTAQESKRVAHQVAKEKKPVTHQVAKEKKIDAHQVAKESKVVAHQTATEKKNVARKPAVVSRKKPVKLTAAKSVISARSKQRAGKARKSIVAMAKRRAEQRQAAKAKLAKAKAAKDKMAKEKAAARANDPLREGKAPARAKEAAKANAEQHDAIAVAAAAVGAAASKAASEAATRAAEQAAGQVAKAAEMAAEKEENPSVGSEEKLAVEKHEVVEGAHVSARIPNSTEAEHKLPDLRIAAKAATTSANKTGVAKEAKFAVNSPPTSSERGSAEQAAKQAAKRAAEQAALRSTASSAAAKAPEPGSPEAVAANIDGDPTAHDVASGLPVTQESGDGTKMSLLSGDPACEFEPEGDFKSSIQVFVHPDNTRVFAFDSGRAGTQTALQCHGATPDECLKSASGGKPQSCERLRCSCQAVTVSLNSLFSKYSQKMFEAVKRICSASGGVKILNIGLGGGALTSYLLDHCAEGTGIVSVEKDPRVISMAARFFGYKVEQGTNEIYNLDALEALDNHARQGLRYKVALVDCFEANGDIPQSCRNSGFVNGLFKLLNKGGLIVQHVRSSQYKELHAIYKEVFTAGSVVSSPIGDSDSKLLLATKRS